MNSELEILIKGNTSQLKKDLADAKKELESLSDSTGNVEKNAKGVDYAFKGIKKNSVIFKEIDKDTGGIAGNAIDIINGFKGATVSAQAFKAALIGTGIGAIVVAVGAIAVYWDDIISAVDGVNRELARQRDLQQEIVDNAQNQVDLINAQLDSLKLQGKSDKEINSLKRERLTILLNEKKALLDIAKTQLENLISSEKKSREVLIRLTGLAASSALSIAKAFDGIAGTNFAGDIKDAYTGFLNLLAGTDSKDAQKEVDDLNLELVKLQNTIDKSTLDDIKIDKKAFEDAKKEAEALQKLFDKINADLELIDEEKAAQNAADVAKIYEESGARIKDALKPDVNQLDFGISDGYQAVLAFEDKLKDIRKLLQDPDFNFDSLVSLDQMDTFIKTLEDGAKEAIRAKDIANGAISALGNELSESLRTDSALFNSFVGIIVGAGEKLLQDLAAQAIAGVAIKQAEAAVKIPIDQAQATSSAVVAASSTAAASGPAAAFLLPALIGAAVGFIAASFAGIKFASGGIVPGGSFNGDKVPALLNSSEMILNASQQAELFKIANGNVRQTASSGNSNVRVYGTISGSDILLSSERASRNNKRF